MKRIFSTSVLIIALFAQALGQGTRQISTQNLVSLTDVTSIPLSDSLPEKTKSPDNRLTRSGREPGAPDADNTATGEKKRYWVEAEYLNWRIKGSYVPPLAQEYGLLTTPRHACRAMCL